MKKVVLISCTKSKREYPCEAYKLYDKSSLFIKAYQYAMTLTNDIFIISAKYGLVPKDKIIEPYDVNLKNMSERERNVWGHKVISQLRERFDFNNTEFIILAGASYYTPLICEMIYYELPLKGLSYGRSLNSLQYLISGGLLSQDRINNDNELIEGNNLCVKVHSYFNSLKRYNGSSIDCINIENGIYIMFEKGEEYHGMNRIVRVGTHISKNRLKQRLKDHFLKEDKDGSIFRKNIGKAFLNMNRDPYLQIWSIDTSKKEEIPFEIAKKIDNNYEKYIERKITKYLNNNISFVCFKVDDKNMRLRLEEGIIALLNKTKDFGPSINWLGKYSPIKEISRSGLWLRQGLYGKPLSYDEFEYIINNKIIDNTKMIQESLFDIDYIQKISSTNNDKLQFKEVSSNEVNYNIATILQYIEDKINKLFLDGNKDVILKSGDIAKELGVKNRMPTICSAMRKAMKKNDIILEQPPKGNGTRLIIKYTDS